MKEVFTCCIPCSRILIILFVIEMQNDKIYLHLKSWNAKPLDNNIRYEKPYGWQKPAPQMVYPIKAFRSLCGRPIEPSPSLYYCRNMGGRAVFYLPIIRFDYYKKMLLTGRIFIMINTANLHMQHNGNKMEVILIVYRSDAKIDSLAIHLQQKFIWITI